jgi:hypothetical protein
MIYVILFLVWCVAVSMSPLFVLFITGFICLAVFPISAGKNSRRNKLNSFTKSADNMTIEELDKYSTFRKAEEASKDWDGSPAPGMEGYYKQELDRIMKDAPDDEESLREKEELKAFIAQNRAKEDAKVEEKEARRKMIEQIIEKARQNAKIADEIANKG